MILDIRPETEALLTAAEQQRGVDIETFIERAAQEAVQEQPRPVEKEERPKLTAKNLAVIALMDEWLAEASTDPEDIRKAQAEVNELMENLNGSESSNDKHIPSPENGATPKISAKNAAAIAMLRQWVAEDATADPEEASRADAEVDELMQNLNKNRIETEKTLLLTEQQTVPQLSEKKKAMIAWLDERIAAAPTDPEGIRQAQVEVDELMQNLNRNRIESGEEPLLP